MKNHDFTPINHIFFNFRGGARRVRLPLDPPLVLVFCHVLILLTNVLFQYCTEIMLIIVGVLFF